MSARAAVAVAALVIFAAIVVGWFAALAFYAADGPHSPPAPASVGPMPGRPPYWQNYR